MKRLVILVFLLWNVLYIHGQDMEFSQFYAAPLHLNPGFTGSTIEHRFVLNYRHQWPNIPGAFESYHASYEYNAEAINSGFGLIMQREEAGSFGLTTNLAALAYSYRFRINRKTYISPGIKMGVAFRGIDYNKLVFNDQIENGNQVTADEDAFKDENVSYPDFSGGLLVYSENYWVGAALNHLNKPN